MNKEIIVNSNRLDGYDFELGTKEEMISVLAKKVNFNEDRISNLLSSFNDSRQKMQLQFEESVNSITE